MIRATLALLVLATSSALADVPLSRAASGHLTAPVRIGGGAATQFVVDTGAEGCGVYQRFATARHLLKVGGETLMGQTGSAEISLVLAPDVEIDGKKIGALQCAVLPDRPDGVPLDGIIGADALERFVVVFDTRRMRLSLHGAAQHGQALVSPRATLVDAQRLPSALLTVPVRLNNASGVGVLDTGARRSIFNERFAAAAVVPMEKLHAAETLQGATANALALRAGPLGAFELAGRVTPAIEARVADLPVFETFGLQDQPAMILGLDRLQGLKLVVDYPRRRIWFDPG